MNYDAEQRDRARGLRRDMNEAAKLLWSRLRGRKPGRPHFRREHPLGPYTADFWCAAAKVVIEVDGFTHEDAYAKRHDELRDAWMAKQGILVLRFRNEAVYETLTGVVDEIQKTCADRIQRLKEV